MSERVRKSINNMTFGIIEQVVTILLTFITRTIFIRILDASLLGVNGLFSNILSILSIAELGFGTAIVYGMYKPIAEKDTKKIAALMTYYKKVYSILAIVVLIVGIAIIPFLKYLINVENQIDHLVLYYIIFLSDSVCSYLLANKVAIIQANQNFYIIKRYSTCFVILKNILQILALVIFKNFILYLLIQVGITFLTNLYGAILAKKMYPYAFEKTELEKEEKNKLIENVKSMAIYRLGGAVMNHTDNILISVLTGTIKVGLYSNYNMIISSINRFINIIYTSITASVGDLNASKENEKKLDVFNNIDFFTNWLYGFCSVALFILLNNFISIWIGEKYMFDLLTVFAIVLNFYILGILNPILTYRDTTGLFKQTKYIFLITAVINLILSIILGKIWGIFGILIASAIARILTNFWYEPYILFKNYFKKSSKKYFYNRFVNIILVVLNCFIMLFIFKILDTFNINNIILFVIKVLITGIIPNIVFLLFYNRKKEFKYFKEMIFNILKGGKKNGKRNCNIQNI